MRGWERRMDRHRIILSLVQQVGKDHLRSYESKVVQGDGCIPRAKLAEDGHPHRRKKALDKVINVLVRELGFFFDHVLNKPSLLLHLLAT